MVEVEQVGAVAREQELARLAVAVHQAGSRRWEQAVPFEQPSGQVRGPGGEARVERRDPPRPIAEPVQLALDRSVPLA